MTSNDLIYSVKTAKSNEEKSYTNAEAIADTYFEYHGKYDDGTSPADEFMTEVNTI